MGKRSNFERRPADFYPTPLAAVVPLIPFLRARNIRSFAEPCAGDGDLLRHLEGFGLRCVYAGDIRNGQDALAIDHYGAADAIITNPPWSRDVLHRLIPHFQNIAATWLLLDSDWSQTKQAAPFLAACSDIVAIGRVKWFPGSKYAGKDNCAWYRFVADHAGGPIFRPKGSAPESESRFRLCEHCRKAYEPQRSSSRFCSQACKQSAYRKRLSVTPTVTAASSELFRYVRYDDVGRFEADGWERLPALDQTHHGYWSALMRRREQN